MRHFTLSEFQYSNTAQKRGIDNSIPKNLTSNINELVNNLLDPLQEAWGSDINVTSGYRCDALNRSIGGSTTSAHSYAYAADLVPTNGRIEEFKDFVMHWLYDNKKVFDQYINEYSGSSSWVHIAIRNGSKQQRKQYMLYRSGKYTQINPVTFKSPGRNSNNSQGSTGSKFSSAGPIPPADGKQYNADYGSLTGKKIYTEDLDLEQIKTNQIFSKTSDGEPIYDNETGKFVMDDSYLTEVDEHVADELQNIDEIAKEPDEALQSMLESIESKQEETTKGISLNEDGSYALSHSKTLRELMQMFEQWWELVQTLKMAANDVDKTFVEDPEPTEKQVINAGVYIQSAFDKFGHAFVLGTGCPVCGKKLKYLPPGGYCSMKCMIMDVKNKIMAYVTQPNDRFDKYIDVFDRILSILDQMTLILNAITMIPDIIKELAKIPEEYKQYVMLKINEGFCELQVLIQRLMIWKNKLLVKIMSEVKFGWITKPLAAMLSGLQALMNAIEEFKRMLMSVYDPTMAVLQNLTLFNGAPFVGGLTIDANGFAWALTPRSFISPLPIGITSDMGKIFVNLPGAVGMDNIKKAIMPSALMNMNFSAIDAVIQGAFPPLTPLDYYLEPALFKVRFELSDQGHVVEMVRQLLSDLLSIGPDYIPAFENLFPVKTRFPYVNICYAWFLLGLMDAWAPHSKVMVGSILNPLV